MKARDRQIRSNKERQMKKRKGTNTCMERYKERQMQRRRGIDERQRDTDEEAIRDG